MEPLCDAVQRLVAMTHRLQQQPLEQAAASATRYLEMFGIVAGAYMLARAACSHYRGVYPAFYARKIPCGNSMREYTAEATMPWAILGCGFVLNLLL